MNIQRVDRSRLSPPPRAAFARLCAGLCFFAGVTAAQAQLKVAFVDVAKVFGTYYKTTEIADRNREAHDVAQKELGDHMEEHHKILEEIARIEKDLDNPALSAVKAERQKQREAKVVEAHALERVMQEYKTEHDRALQELVTRGRNQIVEDIIAVIKTRDQQNHYDMVLNISGKGVGGSALVLYANKGLDITDAVLAVLNANHPAATPDAPPQ